VCYMNYNMMIETKTNVIVWINIYRSLHKVF